MLDLILATETVESVFESFQADVIAVIPRLISAILFLVIAYLGIKLITALLQRILRRVYGDDQQLIADLFVLIASVFLWFGAGLALLKILGMGAIAASLGTASGFIALGISYALSNMIADTVAGVYLLRDPDFNPGDTVTTESVTGTVQSIGLRKSRIKVEDGDIVILANRNVESRWELQSPSVDS